MSVFYKSLDGNQYISTNFQVKEFACKDGTDIVPIDMELVRVLQEARDYFGVPVTINSAFRTPAYNKKVGGANTSRHMRGTAADIVVKGVPAEQVYAYFDEKYPDTYGVGKYPNFTHIDVRLLKARW